VVTPSLRSFLVPLLNGGSLFPNISILMNKCSILFTQLMHETPCQDHAGNEFSQKCTTSRIYVIRPVYNASPPFHSPSLLCMGSCPLCSELSVFLYFCLILTLRPPLWSSGQRSWLQIQRSRIRFPALPDFLRSSGSGTGSTQLLERKSSGSGLENQN
jgi:hypothetical protein